MFKSDYFPILISKSEMSFGLDKNGEWLVFTSYTFEIPALLII
jgi:hypothetical protein